MPELLTKEQKKLFDEELKAVIDKGFGTVEVEVKAHRVKYITGKARVDVETEKVWDGLKKR